MSDAWDKLSADIQFKVARRIAENRARELLSLSNVIGVGFGYRRRKNKVTDEVSVIVTVKKKWKNARGRPTSIPKSLRTFVVIKRKRKQVFVPIDVDEQPEVETEGTGASGAASSSRHPSTAIKSVRGTGCCLVRSRGGSIYWLGCSHTFALTKTNYFQAGNSLLNIKTHYKSGISGGFRLAGALDTDLLELTRHDKRRGAIDAAIIKVSDSVDLEVEFIDSIPIKGLANKNSLKVGKTYDLVSPQNRILLEYMGCLGTLCVPYHEGTPHSTKYEFRHVLQFKPKGSAQTKAGYSGAPIVDDRGRLIAMHFAKNKRDGFSLALLMDLVLERFPIKLDLLKTSTT